MAVEGFEFWAPHIADWGMYSPLKAGSIDGTDTVPHDRAVVRAMTAVYHPNKQVRGNSETTIFVAKLGHNTTEETLKEMFAKFGSIESCKLVRDIVTGRSKSYAFIEYKHYEDAEEAYFGCHKQSCFVDGTPVVVEFECERELPGWMPRRLGGGLGGRKESGQLRFGGRDRPFKKPIALGSKQLGGRRSPVVGHYRDRHDRASLHRDSREQQQQHTSRERWRDRSREGRSAAFDSARRDYSRHRDYDRRTSK